jgi:carbamoyl-phosphate synthase large subunit
MFQEVDPLLGPEMRSTGEVLGMANSFGLAYFKAQEGTQAVLPTSGTVLMSVAQQDKNTLLEVAKMFVEINFKIKATEGTYKFLAQNGIKSDLIKKLSQGRPNIIDAIMNKEIQLIVNTPIGKQSQQDDSYIRKTAIKYKIPYITTLTAAFASANGIKVYKETNREEDKVRSLQDYHKDISNM